MLNIGVFLTLVYEYKADATYEQYQYGIDFFDALSKTMPFPEKPYINNLFNGVRDLTKDVKKELVSDAKGKAQCKKFVSIWLVKTLQTATVHDLLTKFVNIINSDETIADRTKTSLKKGYVANDYVKFLADVLVYSITQNNVQNLTMIPAVDMEFFTDCNQVCSICGKPLKLHKAKKTMYRYSIIQIFPEGLSQTKFDEFSLISTPPVDFHHKNNRICVCDVCGDDYAALPTAETYRLLIDKKERQLLQNETVSMMHTSELDTKIADILGKLNDLDFDSAEYKALRTKPLTIKEKIESDEILRRKIINDSQSYYHFVRKHLSELDDAGNNFKIIANQVQNYYLKLVMTKGKSQSDIYYDIVEWIMHKLSLSNDYRIACEIVVSFFVQNCEVFDEISK